MRKLKKTHSEECERAPVTREPRGGGYVSGSINVMTSITAATHIKQIIQSRGVIRIRPA